PRQEAASNQSTIARNQQTPANKGTRLGWRGRRDYSAQRTAIDRAMPGSGNDAASASTALRAATGRRRQVRIETSWCAPLGTRKGTISAPAFEALECFPQ